MLKSVKEKVFVQVSSKPQGIIKGLFHWANLELVYHKTWNQGEHDIWWQVGNWTKLLVEEQVKVMSR